MIEILTSLSVVITSQYIQIPNDYTVHLKLTQCQLNLNKAKQESKK